MWQLANIKKTLEQLKPEMCQRYYVKTIGLFGSVVRNDFSPSSDIDIIVEFNRPVGIEFIDLAYYLEDKLEQKVDLVSKNWYQRKIL